MALEPLLAFLTSVLAGWVSVVLLVALAFLAGYAGAPLWAWVLLSAFAVFLAGVPWWGWAVFGAVWSVFLVPPLRRQLTGVVMRWIRASGFLPGVSATEREAIEAGTVWIDGELFSGHPNVKVLLEQPYPGLTEVERTFLDGPVRRLCEQVDDWEVFQTGDLSPDTWRALKEEGFFGLLVPKAYGGHGFSANAASEVIARFSSVSTVLATTVMVPNSVGPAELLLHYGTARQREVLLPRLARGEELPAFALTETGAGSDAGAIVSEAVLFRGEDGDPWLRVTWQKRYITLAPVATLLGLAVRLRDPERLLGTEEELGLTCVLMPTALQGARPDRRHDPMGIPFWNAPTEGRDVVLRLEDAVIGGEAGVGRGWRMLMESLASGRGLSLPASAAGVSQMVYRVAGAYAGVRKQFGLEIGRFEGIGERLARIGGLNYVLEAGRRYTLGALDAGIKPSVVTAMMKYHATEMQRVIVNDGMDILGGAAISRGPRNTLAHAYLNVPVSITVEGANILTRTLIIFGQGAIRCHPHVLHEMLAIEQGDVRALDGCLWAHLGHLVRNLCRSIALSLTRGRLARAHVRGPGAPYVRKLVWASASFALLADIALIGLGGTLKRRERVTGRFADIFSWMVLAAAVLRRFEADGRVREDLPFFHWAMRYALERVQEGFDGLFANLELKGLGALLRGPVAAWSRLNRLTAGPPDRVGQQIAAAMMAPGETRGRHTASVFVHQAGDTGLSRLERALAAVHRARPLEERLWDAVRKGDLPRAGQGDRIQRAREAGVIDAEEAEVLREAERLREDAIQVDSFEIEAGRMAMRA